MGPVRLADKAAATRPAEDPHAPSTAADRPEANASSTVWNEVSSRSMEGIPARSVGKAAGCDPFACWLRLMDPTAASMAQTEAAGTNRPGAGHK